jgi:uncharacterized phage-associated protein
MSRVEDTILYLLTKAKEKGMNNLSEFQIMKIIYLLEVESYKFTGKSFNGINFKRNKNGPISLEIYAGLKSLDKRYIKKEITQKADYPYPRHCISLIKPIKKINFSQPEMIFLNSVFESYLILSQTKLGEAAYSTEPMQEICKAEKKQGGILKGVNIDLNSVPLDEEILELYKDE